MRQLIQIGLSSFLTIALFSGCVESLQNKLNPKAQTIQIDNTLPIVEVNGHLEDMTTIAFEWKSITDPRAAGFYVYRNDPFSEDKQLYRIKKIESRFATHYVDDNLKTGTQYQYRFSTFSAEGSESIASETFTVKTLPLLDSVSYFHVTTNMPRSAKLIWRPHTNIDVMSYQIERKSVEDPDYKIIKKIDGRLNAEYIDSDLKDSSSYTYRIRVITFEKIVSKPSESITIVTKPLPVPVIRVQATSNIPDAIVLSWSKNPEPDLDYYKIYRASSPTGSYNYHVKTKENSYTDVIKGSAQIKYYKITAVDKDGLESMKSDVPAQGSTVEQPDTPAIVSANASDNQITIVFKPTDQRTASYMIIKTTQTGLLTKSSEEITNVTSTRFVDNNIQANAKYSYVIMSVDVNGIKSKPTDEIEFDIKAK
jgi:hypothetical protein